MHQLQRNIVSIKFKIAGHDVIRLPPYHCDLNPMELAWAAVKRFIRVRNTASDLNLQTLQTLTTEAIESVKQQEWKNYCKHVGKIEDDYWKTDGLVEDYLENFSFIVSSDSATETASDEWDSENQNSSDSSMSGIEPL